MANIWFTSDLHFGHDKEFVWGARGFNNVEEMNKAIVERFNSKVMPEDTVYILGDSMLGNNEESFKYLKQLNGHKHFLIGNHDTSKRIKYYEELTEFPILYADVIKYKKKQFYLSHYPTETNNMDVISIINLYGHTHQTENFRDDKFWQYHVGMDSHDCYPVNIDDILESIRSKKEEVLKNEN